MENHTGENFETLPWVMRESAYDLGQAGVRKYNPWDTSGQNGCDEFVNYMLQNYSNNILWTCDAGTNNCTYYWMEGNYQSLHEKQFYGSDRLYKLVFTTDAFGNRNGIDGIELCLDEDCNNTDNTTNYQPKIGDLFMARWAGGNGHAMLVAGNFSDDGGGTFSIKIVHNSNGIRKKEYAYTTPNVLHNYFFGEIDYGVDDPGTELAEHSCFGFRSIQQSLFGGTLL